MAFLASVIDDAQAWTPESTRAIFVSGFSNGAAMAFRMASELSSRIAALAPVAGYCWVPDPKPARSHPDSLPDRFTRSIVPLRGGEVRSPWQHRYVRRPPVAETLERWAVCSAARPSREQHPTARAFGSRAIRAGAVSRSLRRGAGPSLARWKGAFNPRIAGPPSDRSQRHRTGSGTSSSITA